jgi:hypothetical protein
MNTRLQMVCSFIDKFCKYTTRIMRSSRCYWSAVGCDGWATVVEVGWRRCCLEGCWECCSSLGLDRCGVLFSEARWSQRVSWSGWFPHVFADPLLSPVTLRLTERARRTSELHFSNLTGSCHLANWTEVEVKVTLRLTVSQSVCLGIKHTCGTCEQILFPAGMLLSGICGLVSMGRPVWLEDGSAICSVITQ